MINDSMSYEDIINWLDNIKNKGGILDYSINEDDPTNISIKPIKAVDFITIKLNEPENLVY